MELGAGGVDDVGGDAAAVERGELVGDGGVVLGPVGFEEDEVVGDEAGVDVGGVEDGALVDLAGEAPGGGEVDEDGLAGGAGGGEAGGGPGVPVDGFHGDLAQRQGDGEEDEEDGGDG